LFRCVVFDYPGTFEPIRPSRRVTRESLRDDLLAIADHQGDTQFALFATSLGGLVALETMLAAPERITRAVLQGAFARRQLSFAERTLVRVGGFLPGKLKSLPGGKTVQEQNHRRWFPPLDATRWQFFSDDAGQVPIKSMARRGAIIRDTDLRPRLAEIQQPILLIQAEGDGLVTRDCHEALAKGLPHAETAWMHSAGHLPHLTSPHRLAKFLRDFLLPAQPPAACTSPGVCEPAESSSAGER
jgi:pimeloyl-ACP methyl ester carboxylesterase